MKKGLLFLFILTSFLGFSQVKSKKWSTNAKIITLKGDTFPGVLKYDFPSDISIYQIEFKYNSSGLVRKYRAQDIKGYIIGNEFYKGICFEKPNNYWFANIKGEGPLYVLKIKKCRQSAGGFALSAAIGSSLFLQNCYYEISYYQKNRIAKKVYKDGAEIKMSENRIKEYFTEHPGFLVELEKNELSTKEYEKIADFYNKWIKNKNTFLEEEFIEE